MQKTIKTLNVFLKRFLGNMLDFQPLYQDFKFSLTYENAPIKIRSFYQQLEKLHSLCIDSAVIQTIADMEPLEIDFIDGENLKYINKVAIKRIDEVVEYWRGNCNYYFWQCDEELFNKINLKGWKFIIDGIADSLKKEAINGDDPKFNEGQIHDAAAKSKTTSSNNIYMLRFNLSLMKKLILHPGLFQKD